MLEEVQRDFAPGVFAVAFVACVTGDVVSRVILGQLPVFHVQQFDAPPLLSVPLWVVLGVIAGALGVVFNRALLGTLKWWVHGGVQADVVRADQCHGCGLCVSACPEHAITLKRTA